MFKGRVLLDRRVLIPAAYFVASAVGMVVIGVPQGRDVIALWLLLGLLCFSLSDLRGYARGVVLEWIPFFVLLIAYDSLRGTAGRIFQVHYLPMVDFDKFVFFGQNGTVFLQRHLWHGAVTWYDVACWCVYMTHFLATPILAAILWKIDNGRFRKYIVAVLVVSFVTLATYALFPAAPPWMASQKGVIGPVTRILLLVPRAIGAKTTGSLVEHGAQYSNNIAAVPSLHAGYSLLVAITLWPRKHKWLRPLVVAYPLAMAFTLIYFGEHYFFDILLGWTYTTVTVFALQRFWRSREARAPARAAIAPDREQSEHSAPAPATI